MCRIQKTNIDTALKAIIAIGGVIILYLFALNGRYEMMDGHSGCIDKWKKEFIFPGEKPVKYGVK